MALFLDEHQVTDLLTMEMAIAAVEEAAQAAGTRQRYQQPAYPRAVADRSTAL